MAEQKEKEGLETKVDRIETGIRLVEAIAELRKHMSEQFDGVRETLEDIQLNQKSLTAAVVEAMSQLNLSRSYEKRLQRLESKVFGSPE